MSGDLRFVPDLEHRAQLRMMTHGNKGADDTGAGRHPGMNVGCGLREGYRSGECLASGPIIIFELDGMVNRSSGPARGWVTLEIVSGFVQQRTK